MIKLTKALNAWNTTGFKGILKSEIEKMDDGQLPLQQGLSQGSYASNDNLEVTILGVYDKGVFIRAKTGIFYTGLIPGCNCADDPSPNNEYNEYCEVNVDINKNTGETEITIITE